MAADKIVRRRGTWIRFQDKSGVSLLPVVRATWARKGVTPVLRHRFSWKRMSMAGVLAYRPDRSESAFVFSITDGAYNTDKLVEFPTELRTHFAGEKLIVFWDGPWPTDPRR